MSQFNALRAARSRVRARVAKRAPCLLSLCKEALQITPCLPGALARAVTQARINTAELRINPRDHPHDHRSTANFSFSKCLPERCVRFEEALATRDRFTVAFPFIEKRSVCRNGGLSCVTTGSSCSDSSNDSSNSLLLHTFCILIIEENRQIICARLSVLFLSSIRSSRGNNEHENRVDQFLRICIAIFYILPKLPSN